MTQRKPVKPIYKGKIIEVNIETVALPHGGSCELEIVHHPGGAAAVALDVEDKVCLLRQYRHAAGGWIWELPAGKLDPGEEPRLTAQRELPRGRRAAHAGTDDREFFASCRRRRERG